MIAVSLLCAVAAIGLGAAIWMILTKDPPDDLDD
jgi:hypothetical protein